MFARVSTGRACVAEARRARPHLRREPADWGSSANRRGASPGPVYRAWRACHGPTSAPPLPRWVLPGDVTKIGDRASARQISLLKFSGGGLLECYVELELCRQFGRAASDRKLNSLRPECANAFRRAGAGIHWADHCGNEGRAASGGGISHGGNDQRKGLDWDARRSLSLVRDLAEHGARLRGQGRVRRRLAGEIRAGQIDQQLHREAQEGGERPRRSDRDGQGEADRGANETCGEKGGRAQRRACADQGGRGLLGVGFEGCSRGCVRDSV